MRKFLTTIIIYNIILFAVLFLAFLVPVDQDAYVRAYQIKISLLDRTPQPRMVLVGGSNAAFGFDCKQIEDSLKINVVNSGLHAGLGMKFILDDVFPHLKGGDIVVTSPEFDQFFGDLADGSQMLVDVLAIEPSKVKLIEGKQILTAINHLPSHLKSKLKYFVSNILLDKDLSPYTLSSFNTHGDVTKHWAMSRKNYGQYGASQSQFNDRYFGRFISQLRTLRSKGVRVFMLPANISRSSYHALEPCVRQLADSLKANHFAYICPTDMMSFADTLFFDTPYHLTRDGVNAKTRYFISEIKKRL